MSHRRALPVFVLVVIGLAPAGCTLAAVGIGGGASSGSSSSGGPSGGGGESASSGAGGAGGAPVSGSSASSESSASSSGGGGKGEPGVNGVDCADVKKQSKMAPNGVYTLDPDGAGGAPPFQAYCEMKADGGGWTLALKIDGTKQTFAWDAQLWKDDALYHPEQPDLDTNEAKLLSFSTVSLSAMRLGMIDGGMTRWIVIPLKKASSLSSLVTSQNQAYTATNATKPTWEQLLQDPSMQQNCDAEGFNVNPGTGARVRIGIVSNNENSCITTDSAIGFGVDDSHNHGTTGNFASFGPDHGDRNTQTFGYVMVR